MTTITKEQQQAIATLLETMTLPNGLGTEESACSIAAINLALTGELTDKIPNCMSVVIGRWIIGVQDSMPRKMRNSAEWKRLLPLAAGTGRHHEKERLEIILDWMWGTVLPTLQPIADSNGFGKKWRLMLQKRTAGAANAAANAAAWSSFNASTAVTAAYVTANATDAAAYAAANATNYATAATDYAATAARTAAAASNSIDSAWQQFNPCGLLQKLIEVGTIADELEAQ